ncbi:MAG: serine hydrolase [Candidatus Paceibacterota bacterium]
MKKPNPQLTNRLIIAGTMLAVLSGGIYLLPWAEAHNQLAASIVAVNQPPPHDPFSDLILAAEAVIVMDLESGEIIFAKNEDKLLPLASITKIMSAITAVNKLDSETIVTVDDISLRQGSNAGLGQGRWYLSDLLDFSLVTSSNGAANAIAATYKQKTGEDFVLAMNRLAEEIGLANSYFINPTGLDVGGPYGGSYSTAVDVAKLFRYTLTEYPALLAPTREPMIKRQTIDGENYTGHNTNKSVTNIAGLLASKTGFTDNAGGNLAVVFDAGLGRPYVAVALASTRDYRFADIIALVQATIEYQSYLTPALPTLPTGRQAVGRVVK